MVHLRPDARKRLFVGQGGDIAEARRELRTVVSTSGYDRLVRVSPQEVDHDLVADPRQESAAKAMAAPGLRLADPCGVSIRVTGPCLGMVRVPGKQELNLDAPQWIRVNHGPRWSDDPGGHHSRMERRDLIGKDWNAPPDAGEPIGVRNARPRDHWVASQQSTQTALQVFGQVVFGFNLEAGDQEVAILGIILVVDGMLGEGEPRSCAGAANGA